MMTRKKPAGSTQRTVERQVELTLLEDQVVRMRQGLRAPADLVLEHKAGANAELRAKLDALERRVIEAAGARSNPTKRKIVTALRQKQR
jgi:hypothetical protein